MEIATILEVVWTIVATSQSVVRQREKCRALVDQVSSLGRLLEGIRPLLPPQMSPQAEASFKALHSALVKARKVMNKIKGLGLFGSLLKGKDLYEDLSDVSSHIQACLGSIAVLQFMQAEEIHNTVKNLKQAFSKVSDDLKDHTAYNKEQHDLTVEVLLILQNGKHGQLDKLLAWFSKRFDADAENIRREWQQMKENAISLTNEVEHATLSKQRVEDQLLQQVILHLSDAQTHNRLEGLETPSEFCCPICLEAMRRPVILTSGHSYCQACIRQHFSSGSRICPNSGAEVRTDLLVENISLRSAISRWLKYPGDTCTQVDAGSDKILEDGAFDYDTVHGIVTGLTSEDPLEVLRNLEDLVSVSRTANGAYFIFKAGGVPLLVKLLDPQCRYIEKAATVIQSMTSVIFNGGSSNNNANRFSNADMRNILRDCSTTLVLLLTNSKGTCHLKVAQALTNILKASEVIEYVLSQPGVVSSLVALASDTWEGKKICIKGMKSLAKLSIGSCSDDQLLLTALLTLAKSEKRYVVEESLKAFNSLMTRDGAVILKRERGIPLLTRKAANCLDPAHGSSVLILEQFIKFEGPTTLVEAGFTALIPSLVKHYCQSLEMSLLQSVLKVCIVCLQSEKKQAPIESFSSLLPYLMELLRTNECVVETLGLLRELCIKSDEFKELILDKGGLSSLKEFVKSRLSACKKEALSLMKILLQSNKACQEEFSDDGGVAILAGVLEKEDRNLDCLAEAIAILTMLGENPRLRSVVLDSIQSDSIARLLDLKQCNQAAATLIISLVLPSNPTLKSLELLRSVVQSADELSTKITAGKMLLLNARLHGGDSFDTGCLSSLVLLQEEAGEDFRDSLIHFIARHGTNEAVIQSGSISLLLESLKKEQCRRDAAASIRKLTEEYPSSHAAVHEGCFWVSAMDFLRSDGCTDAWAEDLAASLAAIYSRRDTSIQSNELGRKAVTKVIQMFHWLLKNEEVVLEKKIIAVKSLAKFDSKALLPLAQPEVLRALSQLILSECGAQALELIDAFLKVKNGVAEIKEAILDSDGILFLIESLHIEDSRIQDLAIMVLLGLGSHKLAQEKMISGGAIQPLLKIVVKTADEYKPAVRKCAGLISNLIRSQYAVFMSGKDKAAASLLQALSHFVGDENRVDTIKFLTQSLSLLCIDPGAKEVLLSQNASMLLIKALQQQYARSDNAIRTCGLEVLVQLSRANKHVASLVLHTPSLTSLTFNESATDECKKLGLLLLLQAVQSGVGKTAACKAIREQEGCVQAIYSLKKNVQCSKDAELLLDYMKKLDGVSRKLIQEAEKGLLPWGRIQSASF